MNLRRDKNMPLISVIIPVYNVADYLKNCLDSIVGQSYEKLEVILVDDGSKDESGVICERYSALDSRIKIIHQTNRGLAGARNTGLQHATGEYVSFVDADDYMDRMAYEKLLAYIKNQVCDICFFGHYRVNDGKKTPYDVPPKKQIYSGPEEIVGILFTNAMIGKPGNCGGFTGISVCCGIYKRAFIEQNGLRFESERKILSEDILFNMQACIGAKNIMVYPDYLYYYVFRTQSLTKRYQKDRFEAALRLDCRLRAWAEIAQMQEIFTEGIWKVFGMNLIVCLKQEIHFEKQNGYQYVMDKIKYIGKHERTKAFLEEKKYVSGLQQKILFWCMKCSRWNLIFLILKVKTLCNKE